MNTTPTPEKDALVWDVAIRDTGLLGCGCCVDSEDWDKDGCPLDEDGDWTNHTYEGECIHALGRAVYIARAVTRILPSGSDHGATS